MTRASGGSGSVGVVVVNQISRKLEAQMLLSCLQQLHQLMP